MGMELLKLPAGRLATIFYKTEPQNLAFEKAVIPSDIEKGGSSDDTLPPVVESRSKRSRKFSQDLLDRKGHVFAWKNITLDIKVDKEQKRLLDNVDGELISIPRFRATKTEYCRRLGSSRTVDGSDGHVGGWKG